MSSGDGDPSAVLRDADLLRTPREVSTALDQMASDITARIGGTYPLLLAVMIGGLIPAARLASRLDFPLDLDYVHATRYRGETRGADLHWIARPTTTLEGRTVLVVDDILDEGITLAAILDWARASGAAAVYSAVLIDKLHDRKAAMPKADFTGLTVEDRYVFGCGMDYHGRYRNLRGVYALKG
ncbi:MAG: hypoxanthine-guanine phosphoribosyltransferase [Ectothiorhodospiraceae bacterium]|nr:hypoxanthine-guanine phosphoribosyltransferase [Chromatiales bacterium]MCP5155693.1 hypoxanthine-guanine phosphoribosyltransferase [Ectothiorhodospiraceae bacterium]